MQERNVTSRAEADMAKLFRYSCSRHHPLKYGADMRRRQFILLLLTALAISLHLVGLPRPGPRIGPRTDPGRVIIHSGKSTTTDTKNLIQQRRLSPKARQKTRQKALKGRCKGRGEGAAPNHCLDRGSADLAYDNGALVRAPPYRRDQKSSHASRRLQRHQQEQLPSLDIYSNAPMPYMQRITWSGIALHAGDLPGYPASHGCIRLTHDFATRLFHLTKRGTRVIIAHDDIRPAEISSPRLIIPKPNVALASPPSGTAIQTGHDTITADATDAPLIAMATRQRMPKRMLKLPAPAPGAAPQKAAPISVFVSRKLSKLLCGRASFPCSMPL